MSRWLCVSIAVALLGCPGEFKTDQHQYHCRPGKNDCVDGFTCAYSQAKERNICLPNGKAPQNPPQKDVVDGKDVADASDEKDVTETQVIEDVQPDEGEEAVVDEIVDPDTAMDVDDVTKNPYGCVEVMVTVKTLPLPDMIPNSTLKANDIVVAPDGSFFIATQQHTIKRYVDGELLPVAGTGTAGYNDGIGKFAKLYNPSGIVGRDKEIFFAEKGNHALRKINWEGASTIWTVETLIGGPSMPGATDGGSGVARLFLPNALVRNKDNDIFIADSGNNLIRKFTVVKAFPFSANVTTVAGHIGAFAPIPVKPTSALSANIGHPVGIAILEQPDTIVFTEKLSMRIMLLKNTADDFGGVGAGTEWKVETLANTQGKNDFKDNVPATSAYFSKPTDIELGGPGVLYVVDSGNHRIRRLCHTEDQDGKPYWYADTIAGSGVPAVIDGVGALAGFSTPKGMGVGSEGKIYVVGDSGQIRLITITPKE